MPTSTRGADPAVEEEFLGSLYKGGELLASGKIVEAREHLERAHDLEPKNEKAQNLLGLAYFKLGLFDRASEVYERLVNENPTDATLRVNLGLVYLKANDLARCIKEFETATDLEPTHKKAHNYLGLALAQQGTYAKAKDHFELAGSDQMAEKMARALAAQGANDSAPATVVLGDSNGAAEQPPPPPPPSAPPPTSIAEVVASQNEDTIEVMSDEEVPSEAYVTPDESVVVQTEMRAEAPVSAETPMPEDWGAELPATDPPTELTPVEETTLEASPAVEELPVLDAVVEVMPSEAVSAEADPSWLTAEAAPVPEEAPAPVTSSPTVAEWVTETVAEVPLPTEPQVATDPEASWSAEGDHLSETTTSGSIEIALTSETVAPVETEQPWTNPADAELPPAEDPWGNTQVQFANADASAAASWQPDPPAAEPVVEASTEASSTELPTTPDDDSWATGGQPPPPVEETWSGETGQTQWATEQIAGVPTPIPETAPVMEAGPSSDEASMGEAAPAESYEAPPVDPPYVDTESQAEGNWNAAADESYPAPQPSLPLNVTVEEPVQEAAPEPLPAPMASPAGYASMNSQRLVDLGASGNWVHEPGAGPFHLSPEGLAVTVSGEMLMRMSGLVAVVGSLNVVPENKRRRGRPSAEPFGTGPQQLQRVSGNGVIYLEPGRAQFHAVDLTDQNGVSIDDDGAFLREELVFAFEEPISFDNGRLTAESQALELAHLKGNGRVLLQLEGSLRAMPIPLGAPMVVPVDRVVGWFGRVTPRLMGFGGRGAVELTGEGYALLGSPAERS